jgi:hypothetical protein
MAYKGKTVLQWLTRNYLYAFIHTYAIAKGTPSLVVSLLPPIQHETITRRLSVHCSARQVLVLDLISFLSCLPIL